MDTPWWGTLCSAMDCRHFTMKQKRKRKKPVARTPEAVAKFKEPVVDVAARNVVLIQHSNENRAVPAHRRSDLTLPRTWNEEISSSRLLYNLLRLIILFVIAFDLWHRQTETFEPLVMFL